MGFLRGETGYLRSHAVFLRDLLLVIDIDFGEGDAVWLRVLRGKRLIGRGDGFAWSTPVRID